MNFYANILESKEPVIGDSYFYQTKEEIIKWLNKVGIRNYLINDDLTVDVDGYVLISYLGIDKIPVKFNKIKKDFNVRKNKLTSLKGCPEEVGAEFNCSDNELTSLKYIPKKIGGNIDLGENKIKSLKGLPKKINGFLDCQGNQLTSLEGISKEIDGLFDCHYNQLTSLEYFPVMTDKESDIYIYNNLLTSLKGLKNVNANLLLQITTHYSQLSIKEIEWEHIGNIDEIIDDLYKVNNERSLTVLKRMEELQLY